MPPTSTPSGTSQTGASTMMEISEAKAHVTGTSYFNTLEDARREARERRRRNVGEDSLVFKVEPSPYGGYVVRSLTVELMIEESSFGLPRSRPYADK